MDDSQMTDLSNKLQALLDSWKKHNDPDWAYSHYYQRPLVTAAQREVRKKRISSPPQAPEDATTKKHFELVNILNIPFHDLMDQIKTGESRLSYDMHDYQGKKLTKQQTAHVAYKSAAGQRYEHYCEEVASVHSLSLIHI